MAQKEVEEFTEKTENKTNYILEDTLLDSEVSIEDIKNYNYNEIVKNSPKTTMTKLPWFLSLFLLIIFAVIFGASFLNGNPQVYFTNTIDGFFSYISKNISDNNYEISNGSVKAKLHLDGVDNKELFDEINKLDLSFNYALDNSNGLLHVILNSKYENEKFLDIDFYSDKDYFYVFSEDIYDKYLKIKNNSGFKIISYSDLKIVIDGLNQAFDKIATSEKIYGNRTDLDMGEKTIKVYESKLVIDKKNYKRVSETFVNSLKANEEFVTAFSNIKGSSGREIKKSLSNYLHELKEKFKENEVVEIKLYNDRKTKDFIKGSISSKLGSFVLTKENNKMLINYKDSAGGFINMNLVINANKNKYNFVFNYKEGVSNKENISFNGELYFTNHKASLFKRIKTNDSVLLDDLGELEKSDINARVTSNPKLDKFLKFIK